jgi:heme oxygenase (biliverdin-producing, ferredoxin)
VEPNDSGAGRDTSPARARGLAARLRVATRDAHSRAESSPFIQRLAAGEVSRQRYTAFLRNLHAMYTTLEIELQRWETHPAVSPIYFPELNRRTALQSDLADWDGPDWRARSAPSPATNMYTGRLAALAGTTPELLVAHAYVRYLGDLSGGQLLGPTIAGALGAGGRGAAFYAFPAIGDIDAFKRRYRAGLDAVPLDETHGDRIVAEAVHAFTMHESMFQELEAIPD